MAQAKESQPRRSREQYIALSDLMAVLADVADEHPGLTTRTDIAETPRTKPNNLVSLPRPKQQAPRSPAASGSEPENRGDNLVPLTRPPQQPPNSPTLLPVAPPELSEPKALARSPQPELPPKSPEELTQELWELRMSMLADSDFYGQQINQLKRRFWGLVGISTGAIALLGIFIGWLVVSMKNTQIQVAGYDDAIATNSLRLEELDTTTVAELNEQVSALQTQVPESLSKDLEATKKDIAVLQAQIKEMETSMDAQDKALSVLVSAMQGLVGR